MAVDLAFWLDAWLARRLAGAARPLVLLGHDHVRWWPLTERQAVVAWAHAHLAPGHDFHAASGALPAPRTRWHWPTDADALDAAGSRAAWRVLALPAGPGAAQALAAWLAARPGVGGHTLIWGPAQAPGWAALDGLERAGLLRGWPAPEGWRFSADPGLAAQVGDAARVGRPGDPARPLEAGLHRLPAPDGTATAWAWRGAPVDTVASGSELSAQALMVRGDVRLDARGNLSLVRPWDGALVLRARFGHVQARVPALDLALPSGPLPARRLATDARGLAAVWDLPAWAPDRPARLHLTLPAPALPRDGRVTLEAIEWEVRP